MRLVIYLSCANLISLNNCVVLALPGRVYYYHPTTWGATTWGAVVVW